jgi:hypothetical protein
VTDAAREASAPVVAPAPPARDLKASARRSPADSSFVVVTGVASDTSAERKIEASSMLRAPVALATNESRRADSIRTADVIAAAGRADKATSADSLARQRAAVSPRLAMEVLRTDTLRVAAPPALPRRMAPQAAGNAAEFRLPDAASPVGACYELRAIPAEGGRPSVVADTVQLLDEPLPERINPSWRRARLVGGPPVPDVMAWREIDSVTVELRTRAGELRTRAGAASGLVQFLSRPLPGPDRDVTIRVLPNVRGLPGVQAALARRIACP